MIGRTLERTALVAAVAAGLQAMSALLATVLFVLDSASLLELTFQSCAFLMTVGCFGLAVRLCRQCAGLANWPFLPRDEWLWIPPNAVFCGVMFWHIFRARHALIGVMSLYPLAVWFYPSWAWPLVMRRYRLTGALYLFASVVMQVILSWSGFRLARIHLPWFAGPSIAVALFQSLALIVLLAAMVVKSDEMPSEYRA